MSSWTSSDAWSASVRLKAPEVQAGQILFSSSCGYSVLEFIGEGCFGKVAKCRNLATKQTVAVKILKEDSDVIHHTEREVSMLKAVGVLNPDLTNMVKFFEQFEHMGHTCLVFEMLDTSLYDLLLERDWKPLSLKQIRPIAKQLLEALDALKVLGILHTDIKPDNIMFVNVQDQPLRVKLIDFGAAIPASKVQVGMALQPAGYRAPEVALGLPFTEAIDVWGVGCVLAFLFLAENLFQVDCDYQMMKSMVEVLGQPHEQLLRVGLYTHYFFSEVKTADGPTWRLMTPEEYTAANNMKPEERNSFIELPGSLDDLVHIYPKREAAEFKDRKAFVQLLKWLLHLDGDQRISPCQALRFPFITMSHLSSQPDSAAYLTASQTMMRVCSADRTNTSAASAFGFCTQDLPSGCKDDAAATRSGDSYPITWRSDVIPVTYTRNRDPAARASDRDEDKDSSEGEATSGSSDGADSLSSNGYLSAWSSDGGRPTCSHYDDPAVWSHDGAADFTVHTNNLWGHIHEFTASLCFCCCCCCRTAD